MYWFKIDRKVFMGLVADVLPVIPSRTPYPIIQNIKVSTWRGKLTLLATDLDIYIKTGSKNAEISKPAQALFPGRKTAAILKELKSDTITVSLEENRIVIEADGIESRIPALDANEYPRMFDMPGPPTLEQVQARRERLPGIAKKIRELKKQFKEYRDRVIPVIRKHPWFIEQMSKYASPVKHGFQNRLHDVLFDLKYFHGSYGFSYKFDWVHYEKAPCKVRRGIAYLRAIKHLKIMKRDLKVLYADYRTTHKEYKSKLHDYLEFTNTPKPKAKPQPKVKVKKPDIKPEKVVEETTVSNIETPTSEVKEVDKPLDIKEDNMKEKPTVNIKGEDYQVDVEKVYTLEGNTLVAVKSYKGKRYIDVRKVFANGDPEVHFTSKGIMVDAEKWKKILPGILDALSEELGIPHRELIELILGSRAEEKVAS